MLTIPKPVLLLLSFLLVFGLYYSSLNGQPLWDDYEFIFRNKVIIRNFPYWPIFKSSVWPISVSAEKFLYSIWKTDYLYFHLFNLGLHFLNAYFLLKLLMKLKLPYPRMIFLLFLLHPANVISVSWMIQLKTVLCFTFAICSFLFLVMALGDKRYYPISWIAYLLSALSKSAVLPLSFIFLLYVYKQKGRQQVLWTLPFLLISTFSTYRLLSSPETVTANMQFEDKTSVAINSEKPKAQFEVLKVVKERTMTFMKSSHYYFWQVVMPLESYPVKGQSSGSVGIVECFHLLLLALLIFLTWASAIGFNLLSGYLMITPFLGIMIAPYMNLTWVSEQHLYLALPFFLCFWLGLLDRWKVKFAAGIPALFILFFSIQTFKASAYYKNEIIFYTTSLEANPLNIPMAYNLASAYLEINQPEKAMEVTAEIIRLIQLNPTMKESVFFPYINKLHTELISMGLNKP